MTEKKYVLKNSIAKPNDGTANEEHILDIISRAEVMYENIQNNNDICMQVYQIKKNQLADEDVLDAIQIGCENMIEIEENANDVMKVIFKVKDNINQYNKSNQADLESLLKQIASYEKKSKKILESIVK